MARRRRSWKGFVKGTIVLLAVIQLVPYGRAHTNPPVVQEPTWDSPETRALARVACFDCHSNETRWPAYSFVAPVSWLVQNDVNGGRARLNVSEFQRSQRHAPDASEEVRTGDMPLWSYTLLHAKARLSAADRERLARGLEQMFGPAPQGPSRKQ
jgi:hypothetical protein